MEPNDEILLAEDDRLDQKSIKRDYKSFVEVMKTIHLYWALSLTSPRVS